MFGLNKYLFGGAGLVVLLLASLLYLQTLRLENAQAVISQQKTEIASLKQSLASQESRCEAVNKAAQSYSGVLSLAEIQNRLRERNANTNTVTVTVNGRLHNPYASAYGR